MQAGLHEFRARFIGTIAATLVPVALIAFTTMPMSLHPGRCRAPAHDLSG